MRYVVLLVALVGCGLDDGYPEAADEPFEKRIPSFFDFSSAASVPVRSDTTTNNPVIDLSACMTTVFANADKDGRGFALVHPRDDGKTCEIWMGRDMARPPRLYCQFDREGEVELNVARGAVDRDGCFPLVTRVPEQADLELAAAASILKTPADDFEIDLGDCKQGRYVAGDSFASVRLVDETFFDSPRACEVFLFGGRYCAFPPYSSVRIERRDGRLDIASTRCFLPEY